MDEQVYKNIISELQQEVERLQQEAERYQLIKDTVDFGILTIWKYVFVDCNKRAEEIFGLSKDEIIGKEPFILSPKYQLDGITSIEKAIEFIDKSRMGEPVRFEWVHMRGDGSHFYADVSINKVEVKGETLFQVILRDISRQKLNTERLENQNKIIRHLNKKYQRQNESYEKLVAQLNSQHELTNAVFSAINDGVAVFNQKLVLYKNTQMCFMTGFSEDSTSPVELFNMLGFDFITIKLPAVPGELEEFWSYGKQNNKYFQLQIIRISESDEYLAHLTDYTEMKKVNKHIEESEYKFRSIFHSSTDGILLVGNKMKVRDVNATFEKRYFYTRTEIAGVEANALFLNDALGTFEHWVRMNTGQKNQFAEFEIVAGNGKLYPVEIDTRLMQLGANEFFLVIVRDISYRKNFERRMLHRTIDAEESERKRIAANLHDELGPILSSLKLYNNTLKNKDDEQILYLSGQFEELIVQAVETVRLLSEDLSPVSLYKGGLEKAIHKRLHALETFFTIRFESNLNQMRFLELIEINSYRIINELINNTLKHAQATEICVRLLRGKTNLHIHFSDNGVGFQPVIKESVDGGRGVGNVFGRLKLINATYTFHSEPNRGVVYDIDVPLRSSES